MCDVNEMIVELRRTAARLTRDVELRRDLVQEMYAQFILLKTREPGKPKNWYVKGCEFYARNRMRIGRSVDSPKRAFGAVSWDAISKDYDRPGGEGTNCSQEPALTEVLGARDALDQVRLLLNDRQKVILTMLMEGEGVRAIGRHLGISHPAVIKHRRKIAKIAAGIMGNESMTNRGESDAERAKMSEALASC